MEVVALKDWVVGIAAVLMAGLTIWNFFQSPSKANAVSIEALGVKIDGFMPKIEERIKSAVGVVDARVAVMETNFESHERRVQALENELKHMPSKDAVSDLKLAIVELKGTVMALDGKVGSMGRTVDLIDGYMRKEGAS